MDHIDAGSIKAIVDTRDPAILRLCLGGNVTGRATCQLFKVIVQRGWWKTFQRQLVYFDPDASLSELTPDDVRRFQTQLRHMVPATGNSQAHKIAFLPRSGMDEGIIAYWCYLSAEWDCIEQRMFDSKRDACIWFGTT